MNQFEAMFIDSKFSWKLRPLQLSELLSEASGRPPTHFEATQLGSAPSSCGAPALMPQLCSSKPRPFSASKPMAQKTLQFRP